MSILAHVATSARRENSRPEFKLAVREWLRVEHGVPSYAYEAYGSAPGALSTDYLCWIGCPRVEGPAGDALDGLDSLTDYSADWWDVDPYGDPFPALRRIAERATAPRIAVFVCDGGLLRSAKLRTPLPTVVASAMGWEPRDMRRQSWCWVHYPQALTLILRRLFAPRYRIQAGRLAPFTTLPSGGVPNVRYSGLIATRDKRHS